MSRWRLFLYSWTTKHPKCESFSGPNIPRCKACQWGNSPTSSSSQRKQPWGRDKLLTLITKMSRWIETITDVSYWTCSTSFVSTQTRWSKQNPEASRTNIWSLTFCMFTCRICFYRSSQSRLRKLHRNKPSCCVDVPNWNVTGSLRCFLNLLK